MTRYPIPPAPSLEEGNTHRTRWTTCEVKPYFAEGERYPSLIGVKADGDEFERAYISKLEHIERVNQLEDIIRDMLHFGFVDDAVAREFTSRAFEAGVMI